MKKNNSVVVIRYQESVIVRSIQRKLEDQGYKVILAGDKIDEIRQYTTEASLFVAYLPANLMDDQEKLKGLVYLSDVIRESGQRIIFVGEQKYYDDLLHAVPALKSSIWVDRPLDMNFFLDVVEEGMMEAQKKAEKKRILIVDDDPAFAKMMREWMKDTFRIDIVTAGLQAVTFLVKNEVDLVLLDYEMPVVDGPQVLEMLRSDPATATIPVVFLTGVGTKESVARVLGLKPKGYVLKSTPKEEILHYLKDLFVKMDAERM